MFLLVLFHSPQTIEMRLTGKSKFLTGVNITVTSCCWQAAHQTLSPVLQVPTRDKLNLMWIFMLHQQWFCMIELLCLVFAADNWIVEQNAKKEQEV